MDDKTIEVRIKFCDQIGVPWERLTPIPPIPARNADDANHKASVIGHIADVNTTHTKNIEGVFEVRWNWEGSPQGHYIAIRKGTDRDPRLK